MSEFKNTLNKKAVAIKYDDAKNSAPVIVASGMGYMAEKIIETANESGVPVYEDNSLATILTQLELGSQVPEELYQAIVDIYLYFLNCVPGSAEKPAPEPIKEIEEEDLMKEDLIKEDLVKEDLMKEEIIKEETVE
ncbi:EscU/YscU/HrcU family type III secretion system export apparatus switch protein [Lacrimispora sphenoides]|uniref:Flagellar biosynthesis protein n=1 Tax=Lacrimispora sphenoides JCM 1415 TaxID=1297793 RepID=A0ABY1CCZ9_9FIRM|nr:EscU/YscU/HrcU family type III secretion system export apparatus switch protein [Lacrimispora sphenoides]SET93315.1 flagellar biosynthesis protein [[Clostridium] sphenoides JCM 1415]SUY52480.1 type III secretion exporter [Lacrimispora sphenoides]